MNEYEKLVIQWAAERDLLNKGNEKSQLLKTLEELGEVSRAVLKYDHEALKDGIGDVLVTLIILANINGMSMEICLAKAWNEIKDRKGKTVNGSFIKNQ